MQYEIENDTSKRVIVYEALNKVYVSILVIKFYIRKNEAYFVKILTFSFYKLSWCFTSVALAICLA